MSVPAPWVHPALRVGPSPVHGSGLFATAPIARGVPVVRMDGEVVSSARLHTVIAEADRGERPYVDTITLGPDVHLVLPPGTAAGRGNHSCDPNTWWVGPRTLVTRRPVTAGQEVTNDYATSTDQSGFAMVCACRTPLCRGTVRGDDWRRGDLRARYGEHWVPTIAARRRAVAAR